MNTSADHTVTVVTTNPGETGQVAHRLGEALTGGEILSLDGPLGAGKTTFTKGLAGGLGIDPREVTSPTFLLIHELRGRLTLWHLDAYRVAGADEFEEIGGRDLFSPDSVVVVEWAERVRDFLPADRLSVEMEYVDEEVRRFVFTATGPVHRRLIPAVRTEVSP